MKDNIEQQITIGIIAGTIVMLILVSFIIYLVHKLSKERYNHQKDNGDKDHAIKSLKDSLKQAIEGKTRCYDQLRDQIPQQPQVKYMQYYKDYKAVHVYAILRDLGIVIISDVDQMNYKIRLIDEVFDNIPETTEEPEEEEEGAEDDGVEQ